MKKYKVYEVLAIKEGDQFELEPVEDFEFNEAVNAAISLSMENGMDYTIIPTNNTLYVITEEDIIDPNKIEIFGTVRCKEGGFVIIDPLK